MSSTKQTQIEQQEAAAVVNKSLLSVDYASTYFSLFCQDLPNCFSENLEIFDYLKEGDAGFKKPKVNTCFSRTRTFLIFPAEKEAHQSSCG